MSTPAPTRSPAPLQPTRQQIDELDALLQRMLSLPVKGPEEDLDEVDERALEKAAAEEPADCFAELPINYPMPEPEPESRAEAEPVQTAAPELVNQAPPGPVPEVGMGIKPSNRPIEPRVRLTSVIQRPAVDPRLRRGVLMQALVWSNRVFDRWTGRLGAPGRWLRRPGGRSLLGWTGLLCLVAALLLLLKDWVR